MATVRATINRALRKLGKLGSGREARAVDAEDAFEALKATYRWLITSGAFGRLCETVPLADYTARPNERIFIQDDAITITLPDLVQYGYGGPWDYGRPLPYPYVPGNNPNQDGVQTPRDGSVVVIANQVTGIMSDFIYDGTIKKWVSVNGDISSGTDVEPLTLDDEAPLSVRDPMGLSSLLAVRISDEYGGEVAPTTLQQSNQYLAGFTTGFSFPRVEAAGSYM